VYDDRYVVGFDSEGIVVDAQSVGQRLDAGARRLDTALIVARYAPAPRIDAALGGSQPGDRRLTETAAARVVDRSAMLWACVGSGRTRVAGMPQAVDDAAARLRLDGQEQPHIRGPPDDPDTWATGYLGYT
jgi:hypothetical protein